MSCSTWLVQQGQNTQRFFAGRQIALASAAAAMNRTLVGLHTCLRAPHRLCAGLKLSPRHMPM